MAEFISARSRQETSPLSSPMPGPPGRATNHHACSREIVVCDTPQRRATSACKVEAAGGLDCAGSTHRFCFSLFRLSAARSAAESQRDAKRFGNNPVQRTGSGTRSIPRGKGEGVSIPTFAAIVRLCHECSGLFRALCSWFSSLFSVARFSACSGAQLEQQAAALSRSFLGVFSLLPHLTLADQISRMCDDCGLI